ncbi:hypothetical protein [Geoglobus ahangari]
MGIAIIYNKDMASEWLGASKRFSGFRERHISSEITPDDYILRFHTPEYFERVKNTPFFRPAYESIKCVLKSADEVEEHEVVIVPTVGTGHHAERDRWRGYSFFNDLAILIERLKEKGFEKIAVLETDTHHSESYRVCDARFFCISGENKCKDVVDMKCRISRSSEPEKYLSRFKEVVEGIAKANPDVVVWYLGQDLHVREYSEGNLDGEALEEMIKVFLSIPGKKIVLLSSGSREDVFEEVISAFKRHS